MPKYAMLVDYEWCSGCHSCEVVCKEEHGFPVGKHGVRVFEDGPWAINNHDTNFNHVPVFTDLCDLCAERVGKGRKPACVHNCLCFCLEFGTIEELAPKLADKGKQYLWVPNENAAALDWAEELDTTSVWDRVKDANVDIDFTPADASGLAAAEINKSFKLALQREEQKLDETSNMDTHQI